MIRKLLLALTCTLLLAGTALAQININTATPEELDRLKGIGPTKARAIVDYRQRHGPFKSVDELGNVPGIGPATLDDIRRDVMVTGASRPASASAGTKAMQAPAQPGRAPATPASLPPAATKAPTPAVPAPRPDEPATGAKPASPARPAAPAGMAGAARSQADVPAKPAPPANPAKAPAAAPAAAGASHPAAPPSPARPPAPARPGGID